MSKLVTLIEKAAILRADLAEREREVREVKTALGDIEAQVLALMLKDGTEAVRTELATVSVKRTTVPQVSDWDAVYKYIIDNDAPALLQRRLSATAWREYVEAGEVVPGVTEEVIPSIQWRGAK